MKKYRILDAYSGAGGAGKGYADAGFEVIGVDIMAQKNYPFEFHKGDAIDFINAHGHEFDAIHTSPPCQFGSVLTPTAYKANHKNLIPATRAALMKNGKPYIIENVSGVRHHLKNPIKLCGSMFDLNIWRHRYFECPWLEYIFLPYCDHSGVPVLISGTTRRAGYNRREPSVAERRQAIGIDWMSTCELDQAIPPAFTEFIGNHLIAYLDTIR